MVPHSGGAVRTGARIFWNSRRPWSTMNPLSISEEARMSSPQNIHREFMEAWNRRDFSALRSLLHPEYTFTGGDGKQMTGGPDLGVQIGQMYAAAFPDAKVEVKQVYVQGDTAIAEMSARGTHKGAFMGHASTNKPVEITFCNVVELRDGKIYREREYLDAAHILTQIGVLSAPKKAAGA
jgi:steroid delta-isomerase-like uncharacterized protein